MHVGLVSTARRDRPVPDMKDIHKCVVCGKDLKPNRKHVDTCDERCFKRLLKVQRGER